jgi:hypothetical protein
MSDSFKLLSLPTIIIIFSNHLMSNTTTPAVLAVNVLVGTPNAGDTGSRFFQSDAVLARTASGW